MNWFATFALIGWVPLVLLFFLALPRRTALLVSVVGGWLFLPVTNVPLPGLPDFGKINATAFAPMLAILVLDTSRVLRFRPGWRDLPVLVLCVSPFFSSLANGLGFHDGLSSILTYAGIWGFPYLLGRIYLRDGEGVRQLARAIVAGGVIYVPLCLFEIRMSPQLHRLVYGAHQHQFAQTARGGGWRPDVFMQHGLMVAFWLAAAAILALTLARVRVLRVVFGIPTTWCALALLVTVVLCKSVGAIGLLALGLGVAWLARTQRVAWLMALLLVVPPLYVAGRVSGAIDRTSVRALLSPFPTERVESVEYRLKNEDPMVARALRQPLLGWGGWGRSRVRDDVGDDISTADSLWIVSLGRNGLVGLLAALATLLIGPLTFLQRHRSVRWLRPDHAPAFCLALIVVLFGLDCMMNAMVNPVWVVAIGALVSLPRPSRRLAAAPVTPSAAAAPVSEAVSRA